MAKAVPEWTNHFLTFLLDLCNLHHQAIFYFFSDWKLQVDLGKNLVLKL